MDDLPTMDGRERRAVCDVKGRSRVMMIEHPALVEELHRGGNE